jgi:hypothetical protein
LGRLCGCMRPRDARSRREGYLGYLAEHERGALSRADGQVSVKLGYTAGAEPILLPILLPRFQGTEALPELTANQRLSMALRSDQAAAVRQMSDRRKQREPRRGRERPGFLRESQRLRDGEAVAVEPLDDVEERLVRGIVQSQKQEQTFGAWLVDMPILRSDDEDLQATLDELATSVTSMFRVGETNIEEPPLKSKREWRILAREHCQVTAKEFTRLWKAYRNSLLDSSEGLYQTQSVDGDLSSDKPNRKPDSSWHYLAATSFGQSMYQGLNNQRRFDRRERKLAAAKRRIDAQTSVWAEGLPLSRIRLGARASVGARAAREPPI